MALGNQPRRDRWGFLGLAVMLGTTLFLPSMLGGINDPLVRFMLLPVIVAVLSGSMVLMYFKGPDTRD
jgi:hypothetical protein